MAESKKLKTKYYFIKYYKILKLRHFLSILPPKNTFWGVASPPKVATRQNQFF